MLRSLLGCCVLLGLTIRAASFRMWRRAAHFQKLASVGGLRARDLSTSHAKLPRIYFPASLRVGEEVQFSDQDVHYVRNVMRLRDGECLRLFNEEQGEFLAALKVQQGKRNATVRASVDALLRERGTAREANSCSVRLLFAPIKRDRMKNMIEKCTELGVDAFQPVITQRTNAHFESVENALSSIIVQSVEQSERLSLPKLFPAVTLSALLQEWKQAPEMGKAASTASPLVFVCRERSHASYPHLLTSLQTVRREESKDLVVSVLVGPEGGFSEAELESLAPHVHFASLGENVLRTETAAMAALTCIQAVRSTRWEPSLA